MYPGWLPLLGGQSVPEGSRIKRVIIIRSKVLQRQLVRAIGR